ncbi:MAG: RNase adapter RapZ [Gammaproteobacteria bacterium]|nr:RNase adapter RapZ [Gammaproteobacteria bacterium]
MKLVIVSGLSGSGKTIALHTLEDAGYFCVDNLPVGLLSDFVHSMKNNKPALYDLISVAVDARCNVQDMAHFENIMTEIKALDVEVEILFLTSKVEKLLTRFNETRRKHPLSKKGLPLVEAIHLERSILKSISSNANLTIDTSDLNVHELRHIINNRILQNDTETMAILVQSFGFKHGLPADTDFMFDVRCLPNPHWEGHLRPFTGKDAPVIEYLDSFPAVADMEKSILIFMQQWIPCFEKEGRSYMTISIGCTGGQHRSVYLAEKLTAELKKSRSNVSLRHRESD